MYIKSLYWILQMNTMLCQSDLHKTRSHYQVIFTTCSQNKSYWDCCGTHKRIHIPCKMLRYMTSLVAQTVKNPPAMQETWVQSLGWEDPLEEGMATYSSILAWTILMDRGAWWAAIHGVERNQTWLIHDWVTKHACICWYIHIYTI